MSIRVQLGQAGLDRNGAGVAEFGDASFGLAVNSFVDVPGRVHRNPVDC